MTCSKRLCLIALALFITLPIPSALSQVEGTVEFEALKAVYDYDTSMPLNAKWDKELKANGVPVRVVFDGLEGASIPALVGLPPSSSSGPGPYPAVILGHGLGGSKDDPAYKGAMMILMQNGFAVALIDLPAHGERRLPELDALAESGLGSLKPEELGGYLELAADVTTQAVKDLRRTVDLLLSVDQIDPDRIGYVGLSYGAILGATFSGVESRLACAALVVGGASWAEIIANSRLTSAARAPATLDPHAVAEWLKASDPLYFASHISAPTLLIFGGKDDIVPYATAGRLLESLVPEPKTVVVFEESGHLLEHAGDRLQAILTLSSFLTEHLRPQGKPSVN